MGSLESPCERLRTMVDELERADKDSLTGLLDEAEEIGVSLGQDASKRFRGCKRSISGNRIAGRCWASIEKKIDGETVHFVCEGLTDEPKAYALVYDVTEKRKVARERNLTSINDDDWALLQAISDAEALCERIKIRMREMYDLDVRETVNGYDMHFYFNYDYGEYAIWFYGIDLGSSRAREMGIDDPVVMITDRADKAIRIYEFAKKATESVADVYDLCNMVDQPF